VGLGMHLLVSIPLTQATIHMRRSRYVLQGLLRPLLMMIPAFFLYPFWRRGEMIPAQPGILASWILVTAVIAWRVVLTAADRQEFGSFLRRLIYWRLERT
jgi:hypothetical protein